MKILLVNLGSPLECLISTCLLKRIKDKFNGEIHVLVKDSECSGIYFNNKFIDKVFINKEDDIICVYDHIINLTNDNVCNPLISGFGFGYSKFSSEANNVLYGNKKTSKNIFEVYFNLIDEKWRGEGLTLEYSRKKYPSKGLVGFAIANSNLKKYICETMKLDLSKSVIIPFKDNLFKKIDEANIAETIVTDDFTYLNIGLLLRKKVYFLKTINYNFNIELFRSGEIMIVPKNICIGINK
jgi:hypothetical protein